MSPSPDEVSLITTPYKPTLYRALSFAWEEYHRKANNWLPILTRRSRASVIHDLAVDYAAKALEGDSDVHIEERKGLFLFMFHQKVIVRFKKFDEGMRSSNIPTKQVSGFLYQMDLPAMPPRAVHLEVGYQLNLLQTSITGIFLTWPDGPRILRYWELEKPGGGEVVNFPVSGSDDSGRSVFQINEDEVSKEKKDKDGG
jgi:hypothetical protein